MSLSTGHTNNNNNANTNGAGSPFNTAGRPATASSLMERLNIEKADEGGGCGGGFTIGKVFVANNCTVILLVMAGIFLVGGAILTAISYRPREFGEELSKFINRQVKL